MSVDPRRAWVLDCEPREVQIEAASRSLLGWGFKESRLDEPRPHMVRDKEGVGIGWGHFMEMRLGKTPTALNDIMFLLSYHGVKKAIIWSPESYKYTWGLEVEKFGVSKHLPVAVVDSKPASRRDAEKLVAGGQGILVLNYEAIRSQKTMDIVNRFTGGDTIVIYDESITIKGHNSQTSRAAIDLSKECGFARDLTGKPITQGPQDLWSQFRAIKALDGFNYYAFKNTFCQTGGFKGKQIIGTKNEEKLARLRASLSFAARKSDWMDTPGKQYSQIEYELTSEQKKVYAEFETGFMTELEDGTVITAEQIITRLMKLQQVSTGFVYDEDKDTHWIIPPEKSPKFKALNTFIETELTGKVIVVAHHLATLRALEGVLAHLNPAFILGKKHMADRELNIDAEKARFNQDNSCGAMLVQTKAGKFGHTLVGNEAMACSTTFMLENSYNLDDRSQIEERNQGAGQRFMVDIIDVIGSPIERRVITALQKKEDVSAAIMGYARDKGVLPYSQSD